VRICKRYNYYHICQDLICALAFLVNTSLFSQIQSPIFSRIDKLKGAVTSFPMDVVLDNDFRYWIATFNGLVEYNGNGYKTYQMPFYQNNSLGSAYLFRLFFENDSILWIAHGSGVAKFNIYKKQFELVPISKVPISTSLNFIETFMDSGGKLFFISTQLNLLYYDAKDGVVKSFDAIDLKKTGFIYKISESKDRNYYLLHSKNGLKLFDKKRNKLVDEKQCPEEYKWTFRKEFRSSINDHVEIGGLKYVSIQDSVSNLYTVLQFDEAKNEIITLPTHSNKGRLLFVDSNSKLWIYGFGGKDEAFLHDPLSGKSFPLPDKEKNSSEVDFTLCYKVMEDHEKNIWLCTNTGLLTYNPYQSDYTIISKDLPKNIYSYIEQIDSVTIWFGTLYDGIYEYKVRERRFTKHNFLKCTGDQDYNDIWQILGTKRNDLIWVLHQNGKVSRYDVKTKQFTHYRDSIFREEDMSYADDDAGNHFFVTISGRVIVYNPAKDRFQSYLDLREVRGLPEDIEVSDILAIGNKILLIATTGHGLIRLDTKTRAFKIYKVDPNKPNSLRSNMINLLKRFDNEHVFAGTTNGIFSYNIITDSIHNYNYNDQFNLGFVYQLCPDKNKDYLYFIGTNRMYLLNWKTKDIIDLGRKSNIDRANLTELHYSVNLEKLYVISEESIYELQVNQDNFTPVLKPTLYSLESYDKVFSIKNDGEIYLGKTYTSFRISFGASTYKFKDDLEYYYSFDNNDWVPALTNEIAFSNIRGGDHVFKLKLVYKGNRSISSETSLYIHIQKRFHETLWFYGLVLALVLLILYITYKVRVNKLLAIEKLRFQLSRDLHDDMGSTLSTVNILSSIAKSKLRSDPEQSLSYLERISFTSQQMMESMDDIVWSINPMNDTMDKLVNKMRAFAGGILEPLQIDLQLLCDDSVDQLKLNMAGRRDFYLIFKEAINNAAKYSACTRVKVEMFLKGKMLHLKIRDNGVGFITEGNTEGNGLGNMKKRAGNLKAKLNIESVTGEGTAIELIVDLNKV
jgi:ligand-binding sensor domain-containing protein/two-component sensor histidine kinase